jgi:hypothetical protein
MGDVWRNGGEMEIFSASLGGLGRDVRHTTTIGQETTAD